MKIHKLQWLVVYTVLAIILSSCNLGATPAPTQDIGAIQTASFNQVLTQVALASSPTPKPTNTALPATATLSGPPTFAAIGGGASTVTPFAFNTPLAGLTPPVTGAPTVAGVVATITTKNGCNNGVFLSESKPYDGDILEPSRAYQKNFTFMNTGSCTWDEGYSFVFMKSLSTPDFDGYDFNFSKSGDYVKPGGSVTFSFKLRAREKPGEYIGVWKLRDDGGNFFGSMVHVKYVIGTYANRRATDTAGH